MNADAAAAIGTLSITTLVIIGIVFVAYWLPVIAAFLRGHRAKLAIFLVNLFFGWSVIGWLIALIWACNSNVYPSNKPSAFDARV